MPKSVNINKGDKYKKLIVIEEIQRRKFDCGVSVRMFRCICDCGKEVNVQIGALRSKTRNKSCGCTDRNYTDGRETHGMTGTREYISWKMMKKRCYKKTYHSYHNYGGRGISVCAEWLNSFSAFYRDMGSRPNDTSLDRIDVNSNYCKNNCRWAEKKTQCRNQRRTVYLENDGAIKTIMDWSDELGLNNRTIRSRLQRGVSDEEALKINNEDPRCCYLELDGIRMNMREWSKMLGIKYATLSNRKSKGWSDEKILATPAKIGNNQFNLPQPF